MAKIKKVDATRRATEENRELQSLFGGGSTRAAGDQNAEGDLAALLDAEFWAAEKGSMTPPAATEKAEGSSTAGDDAVDVPLGGSAESASAEVRAATDDGSALIASAVALPAGILGAALSRSDAERSAMVSRLDSVFGPSWQQRLHDDIDELHHQVVASGAAESAVAERSLARLQEARQILIEAPEAYGAAEQRLWGVRASLERQRESLRLAHYYGPRVLGYQTVWLALFIAGLFVGPLVVDWFARLGGAESGSVAGWSQLWDLMMWGGIGGACAALYHLWRQVSGQGNFDRRFLVSYMALPLTGMIFGAAMYLLLTLVLALAGQPPLDATVASVAEAAAKILALLLGFSQLFLFRRPGAVHEGEDPEPEVLTAGE